MPFSNRPHRRYSVCYPVTYHVGLLQEGQGTVWNLSMKGWCLSGNVPLIMGKTYPLYIHVPNQLSLLVAGAIVRWNRGQEYGLETLVADMQTQRRVEQLVHQLEQVAFESIE